MKKYGVFDKRSGHAYGWYLAHNPAHACSLHDHTIGEYNRQYTDIGYELFKGRHGYNVYSGGMLMARVAIFDSGD